MIDAVIEFVTQLAKALQELLASGGVEVSLTLAVVIRMARGLLRRYRRNETYRRGCISTIRTHKAPRGTCVWCGRPTSTKRSTWHAHCATAYQIAKGQTMAFGSPLISRYKPGVKRKRWMETADYVECEICGKPGAEIDHRVSLAVAHALGRRAELRAYQIDNLRWLCHDCHLVKTAADRRALASLKRGDAPPQEASAF